MVSESDKRELTFETLEDVLAEARSLLDSGYHSKGNWNLGQACSHTADWASFPMDGFPKPPLPLRAIFGDLLIPNANFGS